MLAEALQKHLQLQPGKAVQHHSLRDYVDTPPQMLQILVRKVCTPANAQQWFGIDQNQTLRTQLAGKRIVEFPELTVVLPSQAAKYDVITPDAQAGSSERGRYTNVCGASVTMEGSDAKGPGLRGVSKAGEGESDASMLPSVQDAIERDAHVGIVSGEAVQPAGVSGGDVSLRVCVGVPAVEPVVQMDAEAPVQKRLRTDIAA